MSRLASLRALRLAENRIHAVASDSFVALSALRALHLDGNGIAYIYPRAFHGLGNLSAHLHLPANVPWAQNPFIYTSKRSMDSGSIHTPRKHFVGLVSIYIY